MHLAERPLNMHRYPNGVDKPGFWHKAVPSHAPDWLPRWHNEDADRGETQEYFVMDSPAALASTSGESCERVMVRGTEGCLAGRVL